MRKKYREKFSAIEMQIVRLKSINAAREEEIKDIKKQIRQIKNQFRAVDNAEWTVTFKNGNLAVNGDTIGPASRVSLYPNGTLDFERDL